VFRDQLVQLVFRVQLALSVSLEPLVSKELKDQLVLLAPLALLEPLEFKVLRDQLVLQVFKVLLAPLALLEPLEFRVLLV
jgi:hypothetical protein